MDMVVRSAGGSKATLYRYFSSKDALFTAIIDRVLERSMAGSAPADLEGLGLEEALRQLGASVAQGALSPEAIVMTRLISAEANRFPDLAQQLYDAGPGRNCQRFCEFLDRRVAEGEIEAPADATIVAEQFISGIVGHTQLRLLLGVQSPTAAEIDARVDAAVTTFLRAHVPPPAELRTRDLG